MWDVQREWTKRHLCRMKSLKEHGRKSEQTSSPMMTNNILLPSATNQTSGNCINSSTPNHQLRSKSWSLTWRVSNSTRTTTSSQTNSTRPTTSGPTESKTPDCQPQRLWTAIQAVWKQSDHHLSELARDVSSKSQLDSKTMLRPRIVILFIARNWDLSYCSFRFFFYLK